MRYDFDIVPAQPNSFSLRVGPIVEGTPHIALFRDSRVVAALRTADREVQRFIQASGFGVQVHASGVPDGCYPAKDQVQRQRIIAQLTDNMRRFDLKAADWGEFDLSALMRAMIASKPIGGPPTAKAAMPPNSLSAAILAVLRPGRRADT